MKKILLILLTVILLGTTFASVEPWGKLVIENNQIMCGDRDSDSSYNYLSILTGVNSKNFKIIGGGYGTDNMKMFYGCRVITGANIKTFTVIKEKNIDSSKWYYGKDKTSIYLGGIKIIGADLKTFKIIYSTYLSKDKNYVYNNGKKIKGLNPKKLKVLGKGECIKNTKKVFCISDSIYNELIGVDVKSFILLSNGYAKDKNYVYKNSDVGFKIIKGEDPKLFKLETR